MENKLNVLFICTGNTARSQMAEAFLRKYAGDRFESFSAGLNPSLIHPLTVKVMAEKGYDLSGQTSKGLREFLNRVFIHYVITVCSDADKNCPTVWPGMMKREHWDFEDPAKFEGTEEEKLNKFRDIRDQIEEKIKTWVQETH